MTQRFTALFFRLHLLLFCLTAPLASANAQEQLVNPEINRLRAVGQPLFATDGIASLYAEGKFLYVVTNNNGLHVFDISQPEQPLQLGSTRDVSLPTVGIVKKGNYLFLSDNVNGVEVFSVADPANPKPVKNFKTNSGECWDLKFDDEKKFLFVAAGKNGVEVWDATAAPELKRVAETATLGWAFAWGISYSTTNKELYVSDRENGLRIFDAKSPTRLREIAAHRVTPGNRNHSSLSIDTLVFVGNGVAGLDILSMANPIQPVLRYRQTFSQNFVYGLARYPLNPNMVYVNTGRGGLNVFDVRKVGDKVKGPVDKTTATGADFSHVATSGHYAYVGSIDKGFQVFEYDMTPLLTNIKDLTVSENQPLKFTLAGVDPDSGQFGIMLTELGNNTKNPMSLPRGMTYDPKTATFTWTPDYTQSGLYNMAATIQQIGGQQLASQQMFTIRVNHVNRQPKMPRLQSQLTLENKLFKVQIPPASDPDIEDSTKLTYEAKSLPRGATFDPVTLTLSWTPDYTQAGDYRVVFYVTDSNSDGKGALQDTTSLAIRVDNVNLTPSLTRMETQTFYEDKQQTFTIAATDPDTEDVGKHIYKAISELPVGSSFDEKLHTLSWKPAFEQAGNYKVKFQVFDQGLDVKLKPSVKQLTDTMTVAIEVKQTNRKPKVTLIGAKTVKENEVLTFKTPATDPDKEDANKLSHRALNLPEGAKYDTASTAFTWKPTYEQSGVYTVVFKVTDIGIDGSSLSDSEAVAITVTHVNRAPKLDTVIATLSGIEDSVTAFKITASDPDREDDGKLKITVEGLPQGATFTNGDFNWKPNFDQHATYKLTYTVTDPDGLKATEKQTLVIAHKNRAPKFKPVADVKGRESEKLTVVVEATDEDKEDAGKLTYKAEKLPQGAAFNAATRTLTWTPGTEQSGDYEVTFDVHDRGLNGNLQPEQRLELSDKLTVKITVENFNRRPKLEKVSAQRGAENEELTVTVSGSDPDKEDEGKLTYSASSLPEGATFDAAGKSLKWKPTFEQSGKYTVNLKVTDGGAGGNNPMSDSIAVPIEIKHVNRPPKFGEAQTVSATPGTPVSVSVAATDEDKEDAGKLKYSASGLPKGAKLDAKTGTITWTPTAKQTGEVKVDVKVRDGAGAEAATSVTIKVGEKTEPATGK
jgi:hypothetical protein